MRGRWPYLPARRQRLDIDTGIPLRGAPVGVDEVVGQNARQPGLWAVALSEHPFAESLVALDQCLLHQLLRTIVPAFAEPQSRAHQGRFTAPGNLRESLPLRGDVT